MKLIEETYSKEPIIFFELVERIVQLVKHLKNMQEVRSSKPRSSYFS